MNKIIITLCLVMIALIGASAVAASADADNASNVKLMDGSHFGGMAINDGHSLQTDSVNINSVYKGETKYHIKMDAADKESEAPIRGYGGRSDLEKEIAKLREEMEKANQTMENDNVSVFTGENAVVDDIDKFVDENLSVDLFVVDENLSVNLSVVDENLSAEVLDHDGVISNVIRHQDDIEKNEEGYKIPIKGRNELDLGIIPKVGNMYLSGYTCNEIANKFKISADEVQSTVDKNCFMPISDGMADYVFKAYGTKTLAEMADELGTDTTEINSYAKNLKAGNFGGVYQIIKHKRDLHLLSEYKTQFIFGGV